MECHPDPPASQRTHPVFSPHPQPYSSNPSILQFRVSGSGQWSFVMWVGREMEWGQQCGMLFLCWGDGLKVTLIRFTPQTWANRQAWFGHWSRLDSVCTHCRSWLLHSGSYSKLHYLAWYHSKLQLIMLSAIVLEVKEHNMVNQRWQ